MWTDLWNAEFPSNFSYNEAERTTIQRYLRLQLVVAAFSLSVLHPTARLAGTRKMKPKQGEEISSTARVEAGKAHLKLEQEFVDAKGKSSTG